MKLVAQTVLAVLIVLLKIKLKIAFPEDKIKD
jgi:hypothetical protein